MKLIIGLGNPGKKYVNTRHNIGFVVLDKIVGVGDWSLSKTVKAEYYWINKKTELIKPQTFMNLSGKAVQYAMQKHKIKLENMVVICDDLDLPLGTVRIRMEGSSGGHNGLQSIIDHIGNKFARIRVGIGSNRIICHSELVSESQKSRNKFGMTEQSIPSEDYVLQNFTKDEAVIVSKSVDKTAEILLEWINGEELVEKTFRIMN
ncbi:MAG: Peptidyl-tRNA hydrolase [uncultured bacterium]|nr:MAG: Peptidyl-tRNA hydrolase [uncultured bacterium]